MSQVVDTVSPYDGCGAGASDLAMSPTVVSAALEACLLDIAPHLKVSLFLVS